MVRLRENLESQLENDRIADLANQIINQRVIFSAFGFFHCNYQLVVSVS